MKAALTFAYKFVTGRYYQMTFDEMIRFFALLGVALAAMLVASRMGWWPFLPPPAPPAR